MAYGSGEPAAGGCAWAPVMPPNIAANASSARITTREAQSAARRPVWIEADTIVVTVTSLHFRVDVLMLSVSDDQIPLPDALCNDKLEALGPT